MEQGTKLVKVSPYVIGRTPAYFEEETEHIITPELWDIECVTQMYTKIDKQSEVYRLTWKGADHYDDWDETQVTPEQMYEELTSNPEYSFKIR